MTTSARLLASARVTFACLAATSALAFGRPAQAQEHGQFLIDFCHYTFVAKPDLADANAQRLLESGLTDSELTNVLEKLVTDGDLTEKRFNDAIDRALRVPSLRDSANELWDRVEDGRRALAREPERIKKAITMLTGTLRQQQLADGRLRAAGEYAVPYLLQEIVAGQDERLRRQCRKTLVNIGRQAVTPLSEALAHLGDANAQQQVCQILGDIGYPHAGASLFALAQDSSASDAARDAAANAFQRIGGVPMELSELYTALGTEYFHGKMALIAYPGERANNVWSYDVHVGLTMTQVPTPIYGDVMAMRYASKALKANSANAQALALFVAADLKRENNLPDGEVDAVYGELRYTPDFYATVYGTTICMEVLGMALEIVDTPLVRDAIAALSATTGGANLFSAEGGGQPLLDALRYPDRRVQYEAALTLARALPEDGFSDDHAVVPLLATAVRTGGQSFAMVVADDAEDRRTLSGALEGMGFTIAGAESSVELLRPAMIDAVAVDLIVVMKSGLDQTTTAVNELQNAPKTFASPIVVLADQDLGRVDLEYRGNRRVLVTRRSSDEALGAAVNRAMDRASGGRISESEAEQYALFALEALRDIAIVRSSVYNIADAQNALLEALDARTGGVRLFVARILALIDDERAQRALFDAALGSQDESEQAELLGTVAESIRRFGTYAEQRHLSALVRVIQDATGDVAEAAATVHGAMNKRPTPAAIELIP